jgi:hypothetical protein
MTVPHLMNCSHTGDGWCAACVATLGNRAWALEEAQRGAEAALADIGDADREPGDDLAWCEARAAAALPSVRAALAGGQVGGRSHAAGAAAEAQQG